jgi:hypothetical protein
MRGAAARPPESEPYGIIPWQKHLREKGPQPIADN